MTGTNTLRLVCDSTKGAWELPNGTTLRPVWNTVVAGRKYNPGYALRFPTNTIVMVKKGSAVL